MISKFLNTHFKNNIIRFCIKTFELYISSSRYHTEIWHQITRWYQISLVDLLLSYFQTFDNIINGFAEIIGSELSVSLYISPKI